MGRGEDPTTYEFSLREMASIEELLIAMLSYEPSAYYHDGAHWNSIDGKLGFELRDAVCSEYVSICCSPAAPERFLVDSARNLQERHITASSTAVAMRISKKTGI